MLIFTSRWDKTRIRNLLGHGYLAFLFANRYINTAYILLSLVAITDVPLFKHNTICDLLGRKYRIVSNPKLILPKII